MLNHLFNRLREPSTWAGISVLAAMFGVPPGIVPVIGTVGVCVGGIAAVLLPEKK